MQRPNRYAKVVGVHPESHSVDLKFLDDGSEVPNIRVLSPHASTNSGHNDLPEPTVNDPNNQYDPTATKDRDIYAVVTYVGVIAFVSGFLYPEVAQVLFDELNRRVDRHASDVYSTIDNDGNMEVYHPSGTYFRIGETPAHEDLTGQDFDQKWKISKNTDKLVHAHLEVWKSGAPKAVIDIDPNGNVTVTNGGTLNWTSTGNATLITNGNVVVQAHSGTVTVDTPTTHMTGNLNVDGAIVANGEVTAGGTGGKELTTHKHTGVTVGSGVTGAPQ